MLTSSDEAISTKKQHTKPCHDCPMRRNSLPGWLGGSSPDEYRQLCHSDMRVDCHSFDGPQCAGVALYRRNVCKRVDAPLLSLPADRENVFATPMEFIAHHSAGIDQ